MSPSVFVTLSRKRERESINRRAISDKVYPLGCLFLSLSLFPFIKAFLSDLYLPYFHVVLAACRAFTSSSSLRASYMTIDSISIYIYIYTYVSDTIYATVKRFV